MSHRPNLIAPTVLVALLALSACTESATHTFQFTSTLTPTGELLVDNFEGTVRLTAGPAGTPVEGTVRVLAAGFKEAVDARAAAERVELAEVGQAADMALELRIPADLSRYRFSAAIDLRIPDDVVVSVQTDNGRVTIDRLDVDTVDTTIGQVDLTFTRGETVVRTSEAPIVVESHDGAIDARTTNAPIELMSILGNARALTTNGFITARVTPYQAGEIFLATTNAGVDLVIPRNFGARFLATTTEPGIVAVNNLNFRPAASFPWQAEGTLGDGAGIVDVRTTIGDIVVEGR
jgi:hypothetical protein